MVCSSIRSRVAEFDIQLMDASLRRNDTQWFEPS